MKIRKSLKINPKKSENPPEGNPSLSVFSPNVQITNSLDHSNRVPLHKSVTQKPRAKRSDQYTKPMIVPADYADQPLDNQTKDWYVMFRYRNKKGVLQQVAKRAKINYYTGRKKIKKAEEVRRFYTAALKTGWNPLPISAPKIEIEEGPFSHLAKLPIIVAIEEVLKAEGSGHAAATVKTYNSSFRVFSDYLKKYKLADKSILLFQRVHAKAYSDWLLSLGYDLTTHNNHLRFAGTFFGYFIEREIIEVNPFARVKKKRDGSGGHLAFSRLQMKDLKDYCRRKNMNDAVLFIDFVEDSLMRAGELRKLKVSDIDFATGKISIINNARAGKETKDKESRWIEITPQISNRLKAHVKGFNKEAYVFTKLFRPSDDQAGWRSDISKEFTDICRLAGYGPEYTLHSLRHTGSVRKVSEGWKIGRLMIQLGHADIGTTIKYLKGLGLYL